MCLRMNTAQCWQATALRALHGQRTRNRLVIKEP
jgi:hypothetical protein